MLLTFFFRDNQKAFAFATLNFGGASNPLRIMISMINVLQTSKLIFIWRLKWPQANYCRLNQLNEDPIINNTEAQQNRDWNK